jgi:hypothetical protein
MSNATPPVPASSNPVTGSPVTSGFGVTAVLGALVDVAYFAVVQKQISPNIVADFTAIAGGFGLVFSKDWNVSGASK